MNFSIWKLIIIKKSDFSIMHVIALLSIFSLRILTGLCMLLALNGIKFLLDSQYFTVTIWHHIVTRFLPYESINYSVASSIQLYFRIASSIRRAFLSTGWNEWKRERLSLTLLFMRLTLIFNSIIPIFTKH